MLKILLIFMKVAVTGFGGGAVMTSLLQKEFVETGLISANEFVKAMALAQGTPGPIAAGLITFIGYKTLGALGIFVANIGVVLPTLIIVILFSQYLKRHKENQVVENTFKILRPVTVALIVSIIMFFAKISVFDNATIKSIHDLVVNFNVYSLVIVFIAIISMTKFKVTPIYIIIMSGILGAIIL